MNKQENGWIYCLQCDYRFNRIECIIHECISNNHGCFDGKDQKTNKVQKNNKDIISDKK